MNKVLFIVPPNIRYEAFTNPPHNVKTFRKNSQTFGVLVTDMPLGVLSLSAYIKKNTRTQTKLVDFNIAANKLKSFEYQSYAEFFYDYLSKKSITGFSPDIVGISTLFTPSYRAMLDIAKCCRKIFPKAMILAGGGVPTNLYQEIFKTSDCFDALCFGEGEKPLAKLLKAKDRFAFMEENDSWITRNKVKKKTQFKYDFIENLDEIPFFDYDILDIEAYKLNPTISSFPSYKRKGGNFPVMTSRGCVFHCCFCAAYTIRGRKMRYYSVKRVKKDFERLKTQYGVKTIIFQDDHFMADRKRVFDIIKILNDFRMNAFFPNSLALFALDREVLQALKSVGVNQLVLAIESGSDRVLREIMHKPLNLSIVKRVASDCRDLGIYSDVNILIGLPGETKKDIEDTRKFLKTINANWFRIYVATPLVGSEMFHICLKKKYLKGNYLDADYKKAVVETEDFTAEYIQEKAYELNLELNFVENSDIRLKNHKVALQGLENAISVKKDHALAYYYAAKCYEKLGKKKTAEEYLNNAKNIVRKNPFWRKYAKRFRISELS